MMGKEDAPIKEMHKNPEDYKRRELMKLKKK
jgi:hypothetical protein